MRKIREEKGITLVALIITIIVLLILAVVAINAVTGDGIIQHATNAKTSYENAQAIENSMIGEYEAFLEKHNPNKKLISFTCEELVLLPGTIEEKATYNLKAEEGMTWYEWCKSEYNTVNYVCSSEDSEIYMGTGGTAERININTYSILGKEIIKADTTYYMNNEE